MKMNTSQKFTRTLTTFVEHGINKQQPPLAGENMLGNLSGKQTAFRKRSSGKTVSFEEQSRMETVVFNILQIFFATRAVLKIGDI